MRLHCSSCAAGQDALHLQERGLIQGRDGQPQAFHRLDTPPELEQAYRDMLRIAKPQRPPRLLCRDVVGGAAGRWFSLGVIVLGLSEIDALADKLWWRLATDPRWSGRVPSRDRLRHLARVFILAHELGHELTHEGRTSPQDADVEAAADYWAGDITARLGGYDRELGEAFFALIGCNEQFCTHPSSDHRSLAYREGYLAGLMPKAQAGPRPTATAQPRVRAAPPPSSGPSAGDILAGVVGIAGLAGLALGALKLLGSAVEGKDYDPGVDRYRNRRGQFTRG